MEMMTVQMTIPSGMVPYVSDTDDDHLFRRNAMMIYLLIQNLTISHGRAAEILGVNKTDLIEFYDSMGIPYLNQGEDELMEDIETLNNVLEVLDNE